MSSPAPNNALSSPNNNQHPVVIIVVVVTGFGCLILLGAMLFALWCLVEKHRKKHKKMVQKKEDIDVDEHLKVQEMVMRGPHGPKTVVLSVDDDVRVHDSMCKHEIDMVGKGLHAKSEEAIAGSGQETSHGQHQV